LSPSEILKTFNQDQIDQTSGSAPIYLSKNNKQPIKKPPTSQKSSQPSSHSMKTMPV